MFSFAKKYDVLSAGPQRGGQEGQFAPGPKGLRDLIIEDFRDFDCRKCSEMLFKPI